MMKLNKIITLIAASLTINSTFAQTENPTLQDNEKFFLQKENADLFPHFAALMYKKVMVDMEKTATQDSVEVNPTLLAETLGIVARDVSNNLAKNTELVFKAEGFKQEYGAYMNIQPDTLYLKPSVSYVLDFEQQTLKGMASYDEMPGPQSVQLLFDPIRNQLIIMTDKRRTATISAANVTMETIKSEIALISPGFDFQGARR